jgi:hypothetical protein
LTTRKTSNPRKFSKRTGLGPYYLIAIAVGLIALTVYIVFRMQSSGRQLIPISVLALIAGVIVESLRISERKMDVLGITLLSFALSFLAFLPGKHEHNYSFEHHIQAWPYWFIILFAIVSVVTHGDKAVPKLTEGITLLQSIAVVYWVIDYGFLDTRHIVVQALLVIGLLFALYSLFHAFTYTFLSRTSRLTLSIWSSVVMLLLAIDNIYRIHQNVPVEQAGTTSHGLYIALQFFLLGVSGIYVIQNVLMLMGFLPGRGSFFNAQYFRELKALKSDHVKRYSDQQTPIRNSFLCVIFAGGTFALNSYYAVFPRHIMIWIVLALFPFVRMIYDRVAGTRSYR